MSFVCIDDDDGAVALVILKKRAREQRMGDGDIYLLEEWPVKQKSFALVYSCYVYIAQHASLFPARFPHESRDGTDRYLRSSYNVWYGNAFCILNIASLVVAYIGT